MLKIASLVIPVVISLFMFSATVSAVAPKNGTCPTGYYLRDQDNTCVANPTNGICPPGYYFRDQDGSCVKQPTTQPITDAYCKSQGFDGVQNGKCYAKGASSCVNNDTGCTAPIGGDCSGGVTKCDLFSKYVYPLINFLAALIGVAVIASMIIGGIQYASSAGEPQKITAAKNRIRNAIIALITFIFLYALLNFLTPGGGLFI